MIRMGLPSRIMVGAGLAPALAFPSIRLSIAFANKVLYGRPPLPSAHSLPEGQQGEKLFGIW